MCRLIPQASRTAGGAWTTHLADGLPAPRWIHWPAELPESLTLQLMFGGTLGLRDAQTAEDCIAWGAPLDGSQPRCIGADPRTQRELVASRWPPRCVKRDDEYATGGTSSSQAIRSSLS
jgi:hypothetical protein